MVIFTPKIQDLMTIGLIPRRSLMRVIDDREARAYFQDFCFDPAKESSLESAVNAQFGGVHHSTLTVENGAHIYTAKGMTPYDQPFALTYRASPLTLGVSGTGDGESKTYLGTLCVAQPRLDIGIMHDFLEQLSPGILFALSYQDRPEVVEGLTLGTPYTEAWDAHFSRAGQTVCRGEAALRAVNTHPSEGAMLLLYARGLLWTHVDVCAETRVPITRFSTSIGDIPFSLN